jgi:hypothetical protein
MLNPIPLISVSIVTIGPNGKVASRNASMRADGFILWYQKINKLNGRRIKITYQASEARDNFLSSFMSDGWDVVDALYRVGHVGVAGLGDIYTANPKGQPYPIRVKQGYTELKKWIKRAYEQAPAKRLKGKKEATAQFGASNNEIKEAIIANLRQVL